MPTDYILFVHGVKTHKEQVFQDLANTLLNRVQKAIGSSSRTIKPIYFFWGDLNQSAQNDLVKGFQASSKWQDFWFRDFRTEQVLEFVGDAALYLSRHVGSQVVRRLKSNALASLRAGDPNDRLHIITHSWGTVILFDILFAARWDDPRLDQDQSTKGVRQTVQDIRNALFGLPPNPNFGLPLASIHTMGSPIALFSLLTVSGESTHDLTPQLKNFLECLYNLRKRKIPWRNFAHPGDPIAYPLEGVLPLMLDGTTQYVEIQDVITEKGNPINRPFQQKLAPLLWGGEAHGSYWTNELVAKTIGDVIRGTV